MQGRGGIGAVSCGRQHPGRVSHAVRQKSQACEDSDALGTDGLRRALVAVVKRLREGGHSTKVLVNGAGLVRSVSGRWDV